MLTGHTKILWKFILPGSGVSTGNSCDVVQELRVRERMWLYFVRTGKARAPAFVVVRRGGEEGRARRVVKEVVKRVAMEARVGSCEKRVWYGEVGSEGEKARAPRRAEISCV